jgi:hypothetical protein
MCLQHCGPIRGGACGEGRREISRGEVCPDAHECCGLRAPLSAICIAILCLSMYVLRLRTEYGIPDLGLTACSMLSKL